MFSMLCIVCYFQSKIDNTLQMIQNADPTGVNQPDSNEMLILEGRRRN